MWYPPEQLRILPYQMYKRKVPDSLTREMLKQANLSPEVTRARIEHEGLGNLGAVSTGVSTAAIGIHLLL